MKKTIAVLEGDGIGPEIIAESIKVLKLLRKNSDTHLPWNMLLLAQKPIFPKDRLLPKRSIFQGKCVSEFFLNAFNTLMDSAIISGPIPSPSSTAIVFFIIHPYYIHKQIGLLSPMDSIERIFHLQWLFDELIELFQASSYSRERHRLGSMAG